MADWPKRAVALLLVASPTLQAADDLPSVEMLEFLGGWENSDGEALDLWYWKEFFNEDVAVPGVTDVDGAGKSQSSKRKQTDSTSTAPERQIDDSSNTDKPVVEVKDDES